MDEAELNINALRRPRGRVKDERKTLEALIVENGNPKSEEYGELKFYDYLLL